jgi:hypothetical protein
MLLTITGVLLIQFYGPCAVLSKSCSNFFYFVTTLTSVSEKLTKLLKQSADFPAVTLHLCQLTGCFLLQAAVNSSRIHRSLTANSASHVAWRAGTTNQ